MRTLSLLLATLFGLPAMAAPPAEADPTAIDWNSVESQLFKDVDALPAGLIKNDWLALLSTGCDLEKHKVHTPFEASVLRNTPYALKGYEFKSLGLRALFRADGAWYVKKDRSQPKFEPKVSACIAKIKAFEKAQAAKWKAAFPRLRLFKERLFQSRSSYLRIRAFNHDLGAGPVRMTAARTVGRAPDMTTDVACTACKKGLKGYKVVCLELDDCYVSQGPPADYKGPE